MSKQVPSLFKTLMDEQTSYQKKATNNQTYNQTNRDFAKLKE